jgi:hypothetical protein
MRWTVSLLVACAALGCKTAARHDDATPTASVSASSSASSAKPKRPASRPIIGTAVKAVRCNFGETVPEGDNEIGATRHLHRGADDTLYFFADYHGPTKLVPTDEGCGYRVATTLVEERDKERRFALDPDGSIAQYPWSDESPKTKCRFKAFDELRYGHGRLAGHVFYFNRDGLKKMDLASDQCAAAPAELPVVGSAGDVSLAGDDLLVRKYRGDWKPDGYEVLRFDAAATQVVKRYGAPEGKGVIDGVPYGCGDGLCVVSGSAHIDIHDGEGLRVGSYNLYALTTLKRIDIAGIVDVPGRGVYVLAGHRPEVDGKAGKGRAELVRLDGVY